ncbi:MAG: class I SAM-dependent methyltransferase [Oscillospiraceae bacterium]
MKNITALVSCFARAYHFRNNTEWVFRDDMAGQLLGDSDYEKISSNMSRGIHFFTPGFEGSSEDALRYIADHNLAPSVLARSAFCESSLSNSIYLGCKQYVIYAAGYDSFAFRNKNESLKIYELDKPDMIRDKVKRIEINNLKVTGEYHLIPCDLLKGDWIKALKKNGFDEKLTSFGSLMGISYYLTKDSFQKLLKCISTICLEGSAIIFDYPVYGGGDEAEQNRALAAAANEPMKARYAYEELEKLLEECGFLIYEHLDSEEITEQFFKKYNEMHPENHMAAPKGVSYCLAVKKS